MKRTIVYIACAALLLTGCGTYTGSGAFTGAHFGSILGSAIGGISGGHRGSDVGTIIGMASLSIIINLRDKKAYLEDFVTDTTLRGQGIGSALWAAILNWAKEKGCHNLEFTCGQGREASQQFYKNHDATVYDTNFFRRQV